MMRTRLSVLLAVCVTACSAVTPTAAGPEALFVEDFSEDLQLWDVYQEPAAATAIVDGRLVFDVWEPSSVALSISAVNLADFDLTVAAVRVSGDPTNSYGVVFRYLDQRNFYRLDLTGDGLWGVSRRKDDQWVALSDLQHSAAVSTQEGAINYIRVVAQEARFTFYANSQRLGSVDDPHLPVGRIGLFAATFEAATVRASFDNLFIVRP